MSHSLEDHAALLGVPAIYPGDVVSGSHAGVDFIGRVHCVESKTSRWGNGRSFWFVVRLDGPLFSADGRRLDSNGFTGHDHVLHLTNPELTVVERCGLSFRDTGAGLVLEEVAS